MKSKFFSILLLSALVTVANMNLATAELRDFTDPNGNTITAEIIAAAGSTVTMKRSDGRSFTTKISVFSEVDQKFIKEWQTKEQSNRTPRVSINVDSGKSSREDEADYDDMRQTFEFKVQITNTERDFDIAGAKGILLVFAKDVSNSNNLKVISRQEFNADIPIGRTLSFTGKKFTNVYDDIDYKHGHRYNGYLLILQNKDGRMIATKGVPDTFTKYHASAIKLKAEDLCNRALMGNEETEAGSSVIVQ
jgi:hypothetical protein